MFFSILSMFMSTRFGTVDAITSIEKKEACMAVLALLRDTLMKYPAIIAAYFIYGYYFFSTMEFYIEFKNKNFGSIEVLSHFDTLLWMWLLAYVLVRVLELREKLHTQRLEFDIHKLEREKELTQLTTLKEITHTLQHELNNPLAVIYLQTHVLRKKSAELPGIAEQVKEIDTASKRIHAVIVDLSTKLSYSTIDSPVGSLICVTDEAEPPATLPLVTPSGTVSQSVH